VKPNLIATVEELDDRLSEPTPGAIDALGRLEGDLLFLGAGGKMGPTLARMARRASDAAGVRRRVLAVSRFTGGPAESVLQAHGVETLRCHLSHPAGDETHPRRRPQPGSGPRRRDGLFLRPGDGHGFVPGRDDETARGGVLADEHPPGQPGPAAAF
jgi:hypothetical protein